MADFAECMRYNTIDRGTYICSRDFTLEARRLAGQHDIALVNGAAFAEFLSRVADAAQAAGQPTPFAPAALSA